MHDLGRIRNSLALGEFEFSRHAFRRAVERNVSDDEIRHVGVSAEIIEEYPDDKYSPSVLLLGFTATGRSLHLQVSLSKGEKAKIITLYEPNPDEWIGFRKRR